jgi:hypothetical protein
MQYNGLFIQENPLLGIAALLYVVVNPHPCQSLAQSQLPHFKTLPLNTHPRFPSSGQYSDTVETDDINMSESSSVRHNGENQLSTIHNSSESTKNHKYLLQFD